MADLKILSFTGNGLIVVQSRVVGTEQQAVIAGAASIGQLAGEIGSTFSVQAKTATTPWTLKIQHRLADGTWEDSLIRFGGTTTIGTTPVQFVESERDLNAGTAADYADLVLRVENAKGQSMPALPPPPATPGLSFTGNARV